MSRQLDLRHISCQNWIRTNNRWVRTIRVTVTPSDNKLPRLDSNQHRPKTRINSALHCQSATEQLISQILQAISPGDFSLPCTVHLYEKPLTGLEPVYAVYKTAVLPLNYRGNGCLTGFKPAFFPVTTGRVGSLHYKHHISWATTIRT